MSSAARKLSGETRQKYVEMVTNILEDTLDSLWESDEYSDLEDEYSTECHIKLVEEIRVALEKGEDTDAREQVLAMFWDEVCNDALLLLCSRLLTRLTSGER